MKISHFWNTCPLVAEFLCQNEGGYIYSTELRTDTEQKGYR